MESLAAALSFDKYGGYIWAAYGLAGLAVVAMVVGVWWERRRVRARLARDERDQREAR